MSEFNEQDFKTTLLNKAEIEQALGIKIDLKRNDEPNLELYSMFEYIPLNEVICLFLGLNPNRYSYKKNDNFHTIYKAIETQVRNGTLPAKVEQDHDINGYEIQYDIALSHSVAEQWAKTHGLLWNVPPYRAVEINTQTADNSELVQQLTAKDEEIARLKAEIENLSKLAIQKDKTEQEQTKDNEFTPCYLNKFTKPDPLAIAIQIRNSEWKDYNPETDAKKSAMQIKKKIKSNHKDISDTLAEMIEKVACPIDRTRNK